ncbi:MAG: class I SAM-dependent methyltransferase [Chitinophagales bacterium]|nr:class I SAM-dependent methyltransferase [Chitinophagales bacterium]MDW8428843.1 class I SAM-dependent methyltransferase [Chitinophagales bacterium]
MSEPVNPYQKPEVVRHYGKLRHLFAAERHFLERHKDRLEKFMLLDVGIGAGRTTRHFAPLVRHYVGIDYAKPMIQWCQNHLPQWDHVTLQVMDARQLQFADAAFDVVLFSFNGIDCVSYQDREKILKEFYRVLKPGGMLLFSFHNANSIQRLYALQWPRNPFKWCWELRRRRQLYQRNGPWQHYVDKQFFHIYDGSDDFATLVCYVKPEVQWADLRKIGFTALRAYNLETGQPIAEEALPTASDQWIFVVAQKP